jgi:hypothetical protein
MAARRGRKRQKAEPEAELADDSAAADLAADSAAAVADELVALTAAAGPEQPARPEADQLVATEEEKVKFSKVNWVWCNICGGGSICKTGRRHKGDTKHEIMSLKNRDKEQPGFLEQALQEFLRVERHGKAGRRELVQEHRHVELGVAAQERPAAGDGYRMKWGSHKRRRSHSFSNLQTWPLHSTSRICLHSATRVVRKTTSLSWNLPSDVKVGGRERLKRRV